MVSFLLYLNPLAIYFNVYHYGFFSSFVSIPIDALMLFITCHVIVLHISEQLESNYY